MNMGIENKKTKRFYEIKYLIIYGIILASIFAGSWYLFFRQAVSDNSSYVSDLLIHIETALDGRGYSLMSFIFRKIYALYPNMLALSCGLAIIIVLTVFATVEFVNTLLVLMKNSLCINYSIMLGITSLFIASIYLPYVYPQVYANTFSTQPWHNSTYILMRLVGLIVFSLYLKMEQHYLSYITLQEMIGFTILLVLVNYAKPNFIIAFAPMMLIFLIKDFIVGKGMGTKQIIKFGICVLASLWILILQMKLLFPEDGNSGMAFTMKKLLSFVTEISSVPYLICGLAFPLFVTAIMLIKHYKANAHIKIWVFFVIGWLERTFLMETGERETHGNFGWGVKFCAFLLFLSSYVVLLSMYKSNEIKKSTFAIGNIIYLWHVLVGIVYFIILLKGGNYFI